MLLVAALVPALVDCGSSSSAPVVTLLEHPAHEYSGMPNLHAAGDSLYLSWLEHGGQRPAALRFAVLRGGSWGPVRTIVEADDLLVNWADFPSLVALGDGRLAAHWLQRIGPNVFAYDVAFSTSSDGGATWTPPAMPHRDGIQTEHGFVSLVPQTGGTVDVIWLDGRAVGEGGKMKLMHSTWNGRTFGPEREIDEDVCDCCQTSASATEDGLVVAYRDRTDEEVRDISLAYLTDLGWSDPVPLNHDDWTVNYCPVNGPAVDRAGGTTAVAWFTSAAQQPRVLLAFADDSGAVRDEPVRVDDGAPVGRVDVRLLPDGSAVVSWLERAEQGAELRLRRVKPEGTAEAPLVLGHTAAERGSGFPRVALIDKRLYAAWTEPGPPSRVRLAVVDSLY